MMRRLTLAAVAMALVAGACGDSGSDALVLMTHDSFLVSDGVLEEFTADTGIEVTLLPSGDAGAMVNQAILTKDNPLADVMFGVDNAFLTRALDAGIFESYESPRLAGVRADLVTDPRVTPIDFSNVCLNYDKAAFGPDLDPPGTLADLTAPEYRGMLVVEDPSTSSPGLAFLLASVAAFGEEGPYTWRDYWRDLRTNDVLVTSGWEEAYYGRFSGASAGDRPLVVSYASSPPAEIIFAETEITETSTAVILDGCFRQVEYAAILEGTDARDEAERLIDFMLSRRFQEDMPLNMFVFPALTDAAIPQVFLDHTEFPPSPFTMDPARIGSQRDEWIDAWADIVLR